LALPRNTQIRLVGQKIRQIRKSRRLTQADLAARIGVTQSDLSRMESGEYKVGLDILFRILQVFELSMSQFFGEPAPPEPPPASSFPDEPELLRDLEALTPEARREVREFIAFKKLQSEFRRPIPTGAAPGEPPRPEPVPEEITGPILDEDEEEPDV
jgi:transcriptional regulator with XRE-family HTH domain